MTDLAEQVRAANRNAQHPVFRHPSRTPAEDLAALARGAEELGLVEHDTYGERGAVALLEAEVAALFGKPAAVFFPSGIMAQQAVLRHWCEASGSMRVAVPDLSHLLRHEEDGPRLLHGFRFEHLTAGARVATAADLTARGPGLGAVLVELPLRDAGCLLPTWDQLTELSTTARSAGIPLHVDGARIWESQDFLGHSLVEIADLADSMYVSFYKGLGGLAGACLVGPQDAMDAARSWRRRMGGTLYHLTPYAVSALLGLRDALPQIGAYVAWARRFAAALVGAGLSVNPEPPHTNTFLAYAPGEPDDLNARLLAAIEQSDRALWPAWSPSEVPGWSKAEVAVHAPALAHDPDEVARAVAATTDTLSPRVTRR